MGEINFHTVVLSDGLSRDSLTIYDEETSAQIKSHYFQKLEYVTKNILNICGSIVIISNLLWTSQCMLKEEVGRSQLISALFAGTGLSYVLLEIMTNRLIINGGTRMGYVLCTLALLDQEYQKCPGTGDMYAMGLRLRTQEWQDRLRIIQGAAVVACIVQFLIGSIGIHRLATYIRPITIAPTMLHISFSVIRTTAVSMANTNWVLFFISASFMLFSYSIYAMYYYHFIIRNDTCNKVLNIRRDLHIGVLCLIIIWTLYMILSSMKYVEDGNHVRIDTFIDAPKNVSAVRLSYSFQWGRPKWETDSILLMLPASIVSIFEVLASYYNRSKSEQDRCGARKEKQDSIAWSSIICWEAVFCLLNVTMGTALGVTINFKKPNETYVGFIVGVILVLIALSGTLSSLFVIVPEPIVSALIIICFISLLFEGLNVMQSISFRSTENLYIFGSSIFLGFVIPTLVKGKSLQNNQRTTFDHVLLSLFSMEFVVAGFVAVILDNLSRVLITQKFVLPVNAKFQLIEAKV